MAVYCWVNGFVTCGLTAYTLGSAPGPTLENEYGKTILLLLHNRNTQVLGIVCVAAWPQSLLVAVTTVSQSVIIM